MGRKERSPEDQARRAKIRELLELSQVSSMDDIQNLFKETIAEFMEVLLGVGGASMGVYLLSMLQRLTKGNMINNKKMDCQPYRKRRPAVKRAAFLRDRERRKTYKETGPK